MTQLIHDSKQFVKFIIKTKTKQKIKSVYFCYQRVVGMHHRYWNVTKYFWYSTSKSTSVNYDIEL